MNTVDAKLLQKLFLAGAKSIEANKEYMYARIMVSI